MQSLRVVRYPYNKSYFCPCREARDGPFDIQGGGARDGPFDIQGGGIFLWWGSILQKTSYLLVCIFLF